MLPVKFDKDKLALLTGARIYEINTSGELHVVHCLTDDGYEQMITFWQPSEEDIRSMIAGKPIRLHIIGNRHPWVRIDIDASES